MKYRIGQILTSNRDIEIEKAISGEKVIVPKGNKVIIGADKFVHHIKSEMIQPFKEGIEVEGYDTRGLALYLYMCLSNSFPIDEMLENYDCTKESFIEEIEYSLDNIGF